VIDIQWYLFSNGMAQQVCTTQMTITAAIYHHTQQGNIATIIC